MYNAKVVYCGNVLEVYQYKEPILNGYQNKIEKEKREQTEEIKKENYARSIKRTKEKIRQLVNCNFTSDNSSFLTLTFKENITDYDVAFSFWKRFKQKVEYKYKLKLKYLGVVEFQERGAIHFHICLFNIPYLKHSELYEIWCDTCGSGGVYIEKICANSCDNVGAYMTKYMTKDMCDFYDNEYKNKKRYFQSRNLEKPFIQYYDTSLIQDKNDFNSLISSLSSNVVYEYMSIPYDVKKKDVLDITTDFEDCGSGEIISVVYNKDIQENILYTQQLYYRQIILEFNKDYRNNNKSFVKVL